jgi:hypothetical protein
VTRGAAARLCAALGLGAVLHLAAGVLPGPPLGHLGGLAEWWWKEGPLVACFSLLRLSVIAVAIGWAALLMAVLVTGALGAAPRFLGWAGSGSLLRVALGLSASGLAVAACSSAPRVPPPAPTLLNLGPPHSAVPPSATRPAKAIPPSRTRPVERPAGSGLAPPTTSVPAPEPGVQAKPALATGAAARPPGGQAWTVKPGDSLWSIACDVVGPTAPSKTIAAYWLRLIQLNEPQLADPDLIFPGQVIHLPAAGT